MKQLINLLINVIYGLLGFSVYIMCLDHRYIMVGMFLLTILGFNIIKRIFKLGVYNNK